MRDDKLRQDGWRVLRFWNNEILGARESVLQAISEALVPIQKDGPHPCPPPLASEGTERDGSGAT